MTRKDAILQKALNLFNERGYFDVGVRELARLLDISPGNLSYHFSKKEDIIIVLLENFTSQNTGFYEEYYQTPPSLAGLLTMLKNIFESQYDYRGVYIGNQFVQKEVQEQDRFNYNEIAEKRRSAFRQIFLGLEKVGHLSFSEGDIDFLIAFIGLFGRFWISEATIFNRSPDKEEVVKNYIGLLARQLSLFATPQGKESIKSFLIQNNFE